jgi:hypothetical protein
VPRVDAQGRPYGEAERKAMHTTMQTLGRVAVIGGLALVSIANVYVFHGTDNMPAAEKARLYASVYTWALVIPVLSVLGVILHRFVKHERPAAEPTRPNWAVLGGSLAFVAATLAVGIGGLPYAQELIFAVSLAIIVFLLWRLARELGAEAREVLVATALILFVFRAVPGTGAASTWWMIDVLGFDESFQAKLALVAYVLTLAGMFALRRYMAQTPLWKIVVMLTLAGTVLALPNIGMYYGLHEWTARHTGGLVDARTIALIDTALESPLGQIAMIPMLAWIANSAPPSLKATYFAVMASFSNLALSAAALGTRYLNEAFVVTRQVLDRGTGAVQVPQDYSELGFLMISATAIGLFLPLVTVAVVRAMKLRTA